MHAIDPTRGIVTPKDKEFSLIQSRADDWALSESFLVEQALPLAPRGTIVWQQTLSPYTLATMQQHYVSDQEGTIANAIRNYMDFDLTELEVQLLSATAPAVEADIAVVFTKPHITLTNESFTAFVDARTGPGGKPFPGVFLTTLSRLRSAKRMCFQGEWQKGGRPIGLSGDLLAASSMVGRVYVGFMTNPVGLQINQTVAASSADTGMSLAMPEAGVTGPFAQLKMRVRVNWIYRAPGQDISNLATTRLQSNITIAGIPVRFDPVGFGDFSGLPASGVVPGNITPLVSGQAESLLTNNATVSYQPSPVVSLANNDGTTNDFFATTIEFLSSAAIAGIEAFLPPGLGQLLVWGGRTMLAVADKYVNTQSGMLYKEKTVAANNGVSMTTGAGSGSNYRLGPMTTTFTPGAASDSNLPLNQVCYGIMQALATAAGGSSPDSVAAALWNMAHTAQQNGFYPLFLTNGDGAERHSFSVNEIVDFFVHSIGGTPALSRTFTSPGSNADDALAGLPLHESGFRNLTSSIASQFADREPPQRFMYIHNVGVPGPKTGRPDDEGVNRKAAVVTREIEFFDSLIWDAGGVPYPALTYDGGVDGVLAVGADYPSRIAQFFGVEPANDGSLCVEFAYACVAVEDSADWSIFIDRPEGVLDSGHMRLFIPDVTLAVRDYYITELLTRNSSTGLLVPSQLGAPASPEVLYLISVPGRCPV